MKDKWKDIASAPKDGRALLLIGHIVGLQSTQMTIGRYEVSGWYGSHGFYLVPSHWMELPPFPEIDSSEP